MRRCLTVDSNPIRGAFGGLAPAKRIFKFKNHAVHSVASMASSAAAAPSIERIISLDSGDLWARFSDSTSVCLHAGGATFSTCGGVPEGQYHHDPSSSPAAPSSSPSSAYSSSAALDRRCQVTRFCTHSWREKLRALLRFRNLVGTRTTAAADASADADAIDVRPIVDADDLLPPDAEADAGAADFTVRF